MVTIKLPQPYTDSLSSHGNAAASTSVDVLILGAGWTSRYLIPLLVKEGISHAATTTTGRDGTIPFRFDPSSDSDLPFQSLPVAKSVLITFPLTGVGQSKLLTSLYAKSHPSSKNTQWIQLGSTGIYYESGWSDRHSRYDTDDKRAIAEDELLSAGGCVLNLAGLYGGPDRNPKNWLNRVFKTKSDVKKKGAIHLIHGHDVARAVVALHGKFTAGQRWIVTDMRIYDWWELIMCWGPEIRSNAADDLPAYETWVSELMIEKHIRALPRDAEKLGRTLDSRGFWEEMGICPAMSLRGEY
jgi:hypothetical protein